MVWHCLLNFSNVFPLVSDFWSPLLIIYFFICYSTAFSVENVHCILNAKEFFGHAGSLLNYIMRFELSSFSHGSKKAIRVVEVHREIFV